MGCDIHMVAQVKQDGNWQTVDRLSISRCYDLFAILAGVRNGCGFSGVPTGDGFSPIDRPRGLPPDFDGTSEDHGLGYHSFSWLSLRELQECDLTRTTRKYRWIESKQRMKALPPQTYRQCVGLAWDNLLSRLVSRGNPDEVRIVFGFDS